MGIGYNPRIVTRGLIFYVDAGNSKCEKGLNAITEMASGLASQTHNVVVNGGGWWVYSGNVANYTLFPRSALFDTQTPSVEVWIKTNATSQLGFFFEKGAVNTQYSLFQENANLTWRQKFSDGLYSLTAPTASYISTSAWAHIVGTYTAGDRRMFVNGVQIASDTKNATVSTDAGGEQIGLHGGGGYPFNGNIAIVKVYNVALTPDEVAQNFNALRGRFGV